MNATQKTPPRAEDFDYGFDAFADMDEDIPTGPAFEPTRSRSNCFEKRVPTDRAEVLYTEDCSACHGTGNFRSWSGRIVGECFKCNGKGKLTFKTPKHVRDANRIKSADRKEAKKLSNLESFEAEYPQIAAWWKDSTFDFAISLREAVQKFGSLTDGQLRAALRCVEKFSAAKMEREANQAAQAAVARVVDISPIVSAFDRATSKGLRYPKMYLRGSEHSFKFSLAPSHGRNAGAVYVNLSGGDSDGLYLGKVSGGKFFASRDCNETLTESVEAVCGDPEQAAIAFGKTFGKCSICHRDLTDPESVARGIGPVCADNFFG